MKKSEPELKVHETRKRSILKSLGFRGVEIIIDAIIIFLAAPVIALNPIVLGLLIAVLVECICFSLSYVWERFWNKIPFGRHIYTGDKCEVCKNDTSR